MSDKPTFMTRPWGFWEVLAEEQGYKVKKLTIEPGKSLSNQFHRHRSETWKVIKGRVYISLKYQDGQEVLVVPDETSGPIYIPPLTDHRASNLGGEEAVVIEIQHGPICEEDDIVRL